MGEDLTRGQSRQSDAETDPAIPAIEAPSGWVTTQQAAKALGVTPRTVRWHIDKGNLEAVPQGEGVRRIWLVSIDSLQSFREARQTDATRQHATDLADTDRVIDEGVVISPDISGNPIRELADRLAEEAARAAEYRVRSELTEQAHSTLEEELAEERRRRERAERERDELRMGLEALQEARDTPETGSEGVGKGDLPQERVERRSWLYRFFFGP